MLPRCEVDRVFDLDQALTVPGDSAAELNEPVQARPSILFDEMPTVVAGGGRCAVCMDGFRTGGTQVPCGHVFHARCISQWASVNGSCPLCRTRLSS